MSYDIWRVALGIGGLAWGLPLAACGGFSADPTPQGGSGASPMAGSSGAGVAGSTAGTGGSGGSTGGGGGMATGGRSEPPKAMCTDVTACGGEVPGVWFASSSCLPLSGTADISSFGLGCKMVMSVGKLEVTGNWTLGADGKISDNTTTTGEVAMEMPMECLDISGTKTTCDRLPRQLASLGLKDAVCVDSTVTTGGCTCNGKLNQMGSMGHIAFDQLKMGTYTTADNKLKTMGVDNVEYDYCVQGDIMTVTPKVAPHLGVLNGTVVFQKQD